MEVNFYKDKRLNTIYHYFKNTFKKQILIVLFLMSKP